MAVHHSIAVFSLNETRIRQMNAHAVQLLLLVHLSLSYTVNNWIRIDTKHTSNEDGLIIVSYFQTHDLTYALDFQIIFELSAQLLKGFTKINSVRINVLEEKVTCFGLIENFMYRSVEKLFN
jgi:hypothetical protein